MKNFIYFGIFAIALTVSANADAVVATQQIRSISYTTLSECSSASLSSNGSSCVSDGFGGYYFTPLEKLSDLEVVQWNGGNIVIDDIDTGTGTGTGTGTTTTATVNTCTSDMKLSSDGCCCVMK